MTPIPLDCASQLLVQGSDLLLAEGLVRLEHAGTARQPVIIVIVGHVHPRQL